ncbi:MAG: hypothetical protein AB1714_13185 [Acidobacteriota bacterium]
MAIDPRRRQKQLARKAAKRKAVLQKRAKAAGGQAALLRQIALAPIYECLVPRQLFEIGIGDVILSRRLADGSLMVSIFLVDVFCLGVKSALVAVTSPADYREKVSAMSANEVLEPVAPEYLRRLVEEAVEYAGGLGIPPHPDYREAAALFGNIDATACDETFEFGYQGKPMFVNGPHDSPAFCNRVLQTLRERLGDDGFHFMLGGPEDGTACY